MFFDLKTIEIEEGYHDIVLPLTKLEESSDLLFQQIDLLLDTWTGDFLYNINSGMPYEEILSKNYILEHLESLYFEKISKLRYFKEIIDFNVFLSHTRELTVSFCVVALNNEKRMYSAIVLTDSNGNVIDDSNNRILTP